ncbi:non-heme iron oxygenase ferredoxin subunit [Solilutibacter silvestris]|uniref:non-heme iron oxygenase ferredoxin subunit n=1 Tax=Solilutibacter silvestris TaxID=1645665 RepID=UPI003D346AAD
MSDDALKGWEYVCNEGELLPGEKRTVWDGDTPILVVNLDGDYYAVEDRCTHEDFDLSAGEVNQEDSSIECVLHGAKFDLRNGAVMCPPAYTPVASFPVQVVNGAVWTRDNR